MVLIMRVNMYSINMKMWNISAFLLIIFHPVLSVRHDFCFNFPTFKDLVHESKSIGFEEVLGLIGSTTNEGFDVVDGPLYRRNPRFEIEVFSIKVNKKPLRGWMRLKISTNPAGTPIQRFAINARGVAMDSFVSDKKNRISAHVAGIGEFVTDFPGCVLSDGGAETYEKLEESSFIPCGGVPAREPTVSNGIFFIGDKKSKSTVNLYFRIAQTPCNVYKAINFRLQGFLTDLPSGSINSYSSISPAKQPKLIAKKLKIPYGAPDPLPRSVNYNKGELTCYHKIDEACEDYKDKGPIIVKGADCLKDFPCKPGYPDKKATPTPELPLFSGRCLNEFSENPGVSARFKGRLDGKDTNIHNCELPKTLNTSNTYVGLIKIIQARLKNKIFCKKCEWVPPRPLTTLPPDKPAGMGAEISFPKQRDNIGRGPRRFDASIANDKNKHGVLVKDPFMDELWDTRVIHGVLMTIFAIFVLPVNNFMSRYLKETWMDTRILFHHVWYFVHHITVGTSFILLVVGLYRPNNRRGILGVNDSPAASTHRFLGWTVVGLMIFLTLSGGVRFKARIIRAILVAAHWAFGMFVYFISFACMMLSIYIAGSPSATTDVTVTEGPVDFVMIVLILWIIFDIAMHVAMTLLGCGVDRKLRLTRTRYYLPSPIPVLEENVRYDLPGSGLRKMLFNVYLLVSGVSTALICILMMTADWTARGMGEMSCTHKNNLIDISEALKGC